MSWLRDEERGGLNGWLEAGLFVFAISTLTVVYAVAQHAGAHMVVFILYAMGFAALGMLLISGLGERPVAVALARASLVFGFSTVLLEAFYFLLLAIMTPAETSLSLRLSVPVSIVIGWLFFERGVSRQIWFGSLIITLAALPVVLGVKAGDVIAAVLLAGLCSIFVAVKTFASEFNSANRAARGVVGKLRVTGLVVLSTTLIGAAVVMPLVALKEVGVSGLPAFLPAVSEFWKPATLITAIVLGAPVFVAMTYLTFSSVVKIGTESFLATSAFTPFAVLAIEGIAVSAGLLRQEAFDWGLLPYIAVGIVGVLIVVRARHR
ncbi:MAG: hypothetical protein RIC14_12155 [Filomicrobium sp.]